MSETYTIGVGETVLSVATSRGFLWSTVWNHANNADLKTKRVDPDILLAGDLLFIPDLTVKQVPKPVEQTHRFVKKIPQATLVIHLRQIPKSKAKPSPTVAAVPHIYTDPDPDPHTDEAAANIPWVLYADQALVTQGTTDGNGVLTATVSPSAQNGLIIFNRGTPAEVSIDLHFREMDPLTELPGACKRLFNLGYPCPTDQTTSTPDIEAAVSAFQKTSNITLTGQMDDATRTKLQTAYGA